ncbi:MAG: SLC13/DASS family transporter [Bacteroidales bacterium]|nr:SLC13/DASS family transporter [Candidatus Liminaster caballi]
MFTSHKGSELVNSYQKKKLKTRFQMSGYAKAVIAAIVAIVIALLPTAAFGIEGLNPVQQRVIAIFVFAAVMWLTEAIPSWCTSVLIIVVMLFTISDKCLMPLQGVEGATYVSYKSIMACFADPTILLFIGGFILAIALTKTGIDVVLAKKLLAPFGNKPATVLLGFIMVTAIFSAFVSNTATAAMMLAFLGPVLRQMPEGSKDRVALALAIPLGANIGGIATPIGTPPNTIVLGYLEETMKISIGFGEWMIKMVPYVIILLLCGWMLLRLLFPFQQKEINLKIEGELHWTHKTWIVIITFAATILLWCFGKIDGVYDLGLNSFIVALVPVAVFAVTGVIDKHDLSEINWAVLWMVAGGFALGVALNASGLSKVLVDAIPFASWPYVLVMIIASLVCFGFSNFISHSAAASLLVPVLGVVAGAMNNAGAITNGEVVQMLLCVAVAASVSMILPISTPPNAIAHSTGFIKQSEMMKVGIIVGILGLVIGFFWLKLPFIFG